MSSVIETESRVSAVHLEGLALLKIVKHCHENLPAISSGSLLGMVSAEGILEVTHAFPVPDIRVNTDDDETTEGSDYQMEMMRMLKEVNVDYNCVGWYQSMYLGIYSTSNTLENQLSYQTDLSPNAVVILFDPMQTAHGKLVIKCYRLSEECVKLRNEGKNDFIRPENIFEEVPIKFTNPGLVRAFLRDVKDKVHTIDPTDANPQDVVLDRLDLSTNPYLEKHMEYMSTWTDELVSEQQKSQYYSRHLARGQADKDEKSSRGDDGWESNDAPRRMDGLIIANQLRSFCDQVDSFTSDSLTKLYAVKGLHTSDKSS